MRTGASAVHAAGAIVALLAVLQACAGGGGARAPASPPASTAELEALYEARVDSALTRYTEADAAFMAGMIDHHAQALEMAALAPSRAADARVRTLAARITTGQEAEIGLMTQWLAERGLSKADEHRHDMPGMLTPAQMTELEAATGRGFDRLFLVDMIRHHQGAITMVDQLFAVPGAAQDASTFRIASGVQVDQRAEIARMESMLEALDE